MPRQSQSNNAVVVLGGGRGLARVLRALRQENSDSTAIVSIAHEAQHAGDPPHSLTSAALEDLRRSLEAMAGQEGALLRTIRRPLTIDRRGTLGTLVIASVAEAFGDYGRATAWLGEQLDVAGEVVPATAEPVQLLIEPAAEAATPGSSGRSEHMLSRVRFVGERLDSSDAAVAAIDHAQWVLLAPGSLYRNVLATAAVPDLVDALARTRARVLWIPSLAPDSREGAHMTARDHLRALRLHRIRIDAVMHDPSATLGFDAAELTSQGVDSVACELRDQANPAAHDLGQLRLALRGLIGSRTTSAVGGQS